MATLTLKQVPDELYDWLKQRAREQRRSLNAQVIHDLEALVRGAKATDHARLLRETRRLRAGVESPRLTDDVLRAARQWGRE
jgi:hypothetical protein